MVVPARSRVPDIRVGIASGNDVMLAEIADAAEKPQSISLDRTAEGSVGIPCLDQRGRIRDAEASQFIVEVVTL